MKKISLMLAPIAASLLLSACSDIEVAPLGEEIIPPGEQQIISDISELLIHKLNEQYQGETFLRDTHPKANACLHGTFTVNKDIDPAFQHGVFQPGASHPLWMRLSNAVEEVTSDYDKDFRGLAMKLTQVNGERVSMSALPIVQGKRQLLSHGDERHTQDFLFLGHDAFFAADPQDFFEFFSGSLAKFALTHPQGIWNIIAGEQRVVTPLDIKWNSVTGYALGDKKEDGAYENVVRYAMQTCTVNGGAPADKNKPDYLSENLAKQLSGDGRGCLDFYIQRQLDADAMPVENALVAWDQTLSPFIKIARIDIPPQVFTSQAQKDFCENMSFNPWHSLVQHKPLGGINRARRQVMKDISDERLRHNGVSRFEPNGLERFK
ncbi:MAG: hypothetical protein RPT11_00490 [Bermanella sp.]